MVPAALGLPRQHADDPRRVRSLAQGTRALLLARSAEVLAQALHRVEQLLPEAAQPLQPLLRLLQVSRQQLLEPERELGGGVAAPPQLQDRADLAERQPQLPEVGDELQPLNQLPDRSLSDVARSLKVLSAHAPEP